MRKIPIRAKQSALLKYVGQQYRSHADALKEHVSNALDEHLRAKAEGRARSVCKVVFVMRKDRIIINYPYGMSEQEFEEVLQRVADSVKKDLDINQIGQLGVGLFCFHKSAKRCVFISQKDEDSKPVKVIIREGKDNAETQTPKKRELLEKPGIRIVMTGLRTNPTKSRGPFSPTKLQKVFASKFDSYLRSGELEIEIRYPNQTCQIVPQEINLPRIGEEYQDWHVAGDPNRVVGLELYYDPSGKGTVAIRHSGVSVIDDISSVEAYGLEESVYASGKLKGFIDADFLTPLSSRSGFEENDGWLALLVELDKLSFSVEAEVRLQEEEEKRKHLSEIQQKAIVLARNILDSEQFEDLELLEVLGRKEPGIRFPPNGFDFVPNSIRIDPEGEGKLPLRVSVPDTIPDGAEVKFTINNPSVKIRPKKVVLKESEADFHGLVDVPVTITSTEKTEVPATLIAAIPSLELKTEARVRVAEKIQSRRALSGKKKGGRGINYEERPFEDGPEKHSRFISSIIQINTLNPDFQKVMEGSDEEKLWYAALMIGKETISSNDHTEISEDFLEKLLYFVFQLRRSLQ